MLEVVIGFISGAFALVVSIALWSYWKHRRGIYVPPIGYASCLTPQERFVRDFVAQGYMDFGNIKIDHIERDLSTSGTLLLVQAGTMSRVPWTVLGSSIIQVDGRDLYLKQGKRGRWFLTTTLLDIRGTDMVNELRGPNDWYKTPDQYGEDVIEAPGPDDLYMTSLAHTPPRHDRRHDQCPELMAALTGHSSIDHVCVPESDLLQSSSLENSPYVRMRNRTLHEINKSKMKQSSCTLGPRPAPQRVDLSAETMMQLCTTMRDICMQQQRGPKPVPVVAEEKVTPCPVMKEEEK